MKMQSRAISGTIFENTIAKEFGVRKSKSPKIIWNGNGRNNFDKIKSLNFNEELFYPTDKSNYEKYDLISWNGDKDEIKKYRLDEINIWRLYSEPIVKISTKETLSKTITIFGDGDVNLALKTYNDFIDRLFNHMVNNGTLENIKNEMNKNTKSMYLIDKCVKMSEIDFRWIINKSAWLGFNRITLEFKRK
jgi:hypothetical protein